MSVQWANHGFVEVPGDDAGEEFGLVVAAQQCLDRVQGYSHDRVDGPSVIATVLLPVHGHSCAEPRCEMGCAMVFEPMDQLPEFSSVLEHGHGPVPGAATGLQAFAANLQQAVGGTAAERAAIRWQFP